MIRKLKLKFGSSPEQQPVEVDLNSVTIFVGPNNSGKSLALHDIHSFCGTGRGLGVLIDEIEFIGIPDENIEKTIEKIKRKPGRRETLRPSDVIVRNNRQPVSRSSLAKALKYPRTNARLFCTSLLQRGTIMLDGKNRIQLTEEQPAGNLGLVPQNSLQTLFQDAEKREKVSRIINEVFQFHFVIDPTTLGRFRIKFSKQPPPDESIEQGLHPKAVAFHRAAKGMEHFGDGVKAFTGIILKIYAGDPTILLIDEPETFLHPPLAYKLGQKVAVASASTDKRVFASTHSVDYVMGSVQSGVPVNIIRLTYRDDIGPTAKVLSNKDLLNLMKNPLLRSARVLDGLFYEFVIVTESETDRAFYQEINSRIQRYKPEWGIPNCLFLSAQNMQTVKVILEPLRKIGIPTAGIVDIDVIEGKHGIFPELLKSGFIPPVMHNSLSTQRKDINDKLKQTGKNIKTDGGVFLLEGPDFDAAERFMKTLSDYGIFVVPHGELECWLPDLNVGDHGPKWLMKIFEKMGDNPDDVSYVKPSDNNVWEFISQVKEWFFDPNKKGMPP